MQHKYSYHMDDLPDGLILKGDIAVDTEAMGLNNYRDRLCLVQLADELGSIHLVHLKNKNFTAPNLKEILTDQSRMKIFHFARFDISIIQKYLKIEINNIFCTKIASRLCRTYSNHHSLSELCSELLGIKISKQQQSSDWGSESLNESQLNYAAQDVRYLHQLRDRFISMLQREGREEIAQECFKFLPIRAKLDSLGWGYDIFAHNTHNNPGYI